MTAIRGYLNAEDHERLRHSAEELITRGAAPRVSGGALGVNALALLFQHAGTPEFSADALKLLHELQTHQVELDLMHEQLQANEQDLTEELRHYKSLYECAPSAYLVVTDSGDIIEGNQAAGVLFGESVTALAGRALGEFLAPGQDAIVNGLLQNAAQLAVASPSSANSFVSLPDSRCISISANPTVAGGSIMMILTDITALPDLF